LCEPSPQGIRLHEVDECLLSIDLDDREQLAVAGLEVGVAVDQDLLELETELVTERGDGLARTLAEVTALRRIQPYEGYG
jgi:hypothetical protein